MGLWEMIAIVAGLAILAGVAEKYFKLHAGQAPTEQLTTSELREIVQQAVHEEVAVLHEEIRSLERRLGPPERPGLPEPSGPGGATGPDDGNA